MAGVKTLLFATASVLAFSEAAPTSSAVDEFLDTALPDVDFFMQDSQDLSKDFREQTELMTKQVASSEMEKKEALHKLKQSLDANLTAQAWRSEQISNETKQVASLIARETEFIASLRSDAAKVQKSNDIMRRALDGLRGKLGIAYTFLADSLKATDDTNVTELEVLLPTTPEPTLEHFLHTMGSRKVSLLTVGSEHTKKKGNLLKRKTEETKPEAIVDTLAQRLVDLAAAGEQGEAQLQARFTAFYELGAAKQSELQAQLESSEQDLAAKKALHAQLVSVKQHLLEIKAQLRERVQGVRFFASKGDRLATESLDTAKELFKHAL